MKLHVWCELSDKLFNTIWQIYGQKQRRAITILFCGRGTLLNYLSILSIFWKFPDQEIKVFFTFLNVFFSRILMPCSPHVPAAALRDLDLDLWQGTADYLVLPGLWLPLVTRSRLRHPLAAMKASQPSDKYGFHYCVYSDYFFNFLRVRQVTDMHINHPGLLLFMLTVMVSEREDYRLKFVYLLPAGGRQVG